MGTGRQCPPARALWSARDARERSAVARLRRRWSAHSGLSVMACRCAHGGADLSQRACAACTLMHTNRHHSQGVFNTPQRPPELDISPTS